MRSKEDKIQEQSEKGCYTTPVCSTLKPPYSPSGLCCPSTDVREVTIHNATEWERQRPQFHSSIVAYRNHAHGACPIVIKYPSSKAKTEIEVIIMFLIAFVEKL